MEYDVAIVGAGPAGTTLARRLAQTQPTWRILLLDAQEEAHKKPCGGLLAPDAQRALAHFDLVLPKSVLADPQIFAVQTMDLVTGQVRYYPRYYLNMDRYAFDRWLLSLVPPQVEVRAGRCFAAAREGSGFCLRVRTAQGEQTLRCRFLVGADGARSLVRETFFRRPILRYVAIQQWFRSNDRALPFYSCIFDAETSESCSWMMRKDGYVIYGGCFPAEGCRAAFDRQRARLERFLGRSLGTAVKTEACLADRPRSMRDFVTGADGVYLVGEAAGFISASSFEGISSAIRSASALADAFRNVENSRNITKSYRRKTLFLRCKLYLKTWKRYVTHTPWTRALVMRSGLTAIRVQRSQTEEAL